MMNLLGIVIQRSLLGEPFSNFVYWQAL